MVGCPSWPCPPCPHERTSPSSVKAKEWYPPHATWITWTFFRLGTICGLQSLELLPLPSSKFEFAPQLHSCPSEVSASVKKPPQATAATGTGSVLTLEGTLREPASPGPPPLPSPNLPSPSSRPQVYSSPDSVIAAVCAPLVAMCAIFPSQGPFTFLGNSSLW